MLEIHRNLLAQQQALLCYFTFLWIFATYEHPTLRTSHPDMSRTGLGYIVASPVLFVSPQKYSCPPLTAMLYVAPAWIEETPWARQKYSLRVTKKNHRVRDLNWIVSVCFIIIFDLTNSMFQRMHPEPVSFQFYGYFNSPSLSQCYVLRVFKATLPLWVLCFIGDRKSPSFNQCSVLRVSNATIPLSVLCFTYISIHPPSVSAPLQCEF